MTTKAAGELEKGDIISLDGKEWLIIDSLHINPSRLLIVAYYQGGVAGLTRLPLDQQVQVGFFRIEVNQGNHRIVAPNGTAGEWSWSRNIAKLIWGGETYIAGTVYDSTHQSDTVFKVTAQPTVRVVDSTT